jgi:hypothetical protein
MEYQKPVIVAQNGAQGMFAAGCPQKGTGSEFLMIDNCRICERAN